MLEASLLRAYAQLDGQPCHHMDAPGTCASDSLCVASLDGMITSCGEADRPATLMSAVAGRPHGADEEIVAFVQLREGARATPEDLLAWLAGELVAYRCPSVVAIVPQLPTLHSGKVDRGAIRRMAAQLA